MSVKDSDTLKSYFVLSKVPTPSNYVDLIDTIFAIGQGGGLPDHDHGFIIANNGLTGGGLIKEDNITISLTMPGTLSVSTENSNSGSHIHTVTASEAPGENTSLLKTVDGVLKIFDLYSQDVFHVSYITSNEAYDHISVEPVTDLTLKPGGDIVIDPTGQYVLPYTNYDINLGMISKKYLTLHAAELWVETLVAQNTIATIGGRILVGPTDLFTENFPAWTNNLLQNEGFEIAGAGGADVFAMWVENAGTGTIVQSGTRHSGAYSCYLSKGLTDDTYVYQTISVNPGDLMTFTWWTRGTGTIGGRYAVYDVTHSNWIIDKTATGVSSTSWTPGGVAFDIPSGCYSIAVYFWAPSASGYVYFDDAYVTNKYMLTKYNQMNVNDIVYMESNGKIEFMQILSTPVGSGPYIYRVVRDLDFSGMNDWFAGDAIFNTGTLGDGFIDIYSVSGIISGYGPTIVGNIRTNIYYNSWSAGWAIGNLHGLYGISSDDYGAGLGIYGVSGKSSIVINGTDGTIDIYNNTTVVWSVATTGYMTIGASGTEHLYITSSGITFYDSSTILGSISGTTWTIGQTTSTNSNVTITPTTVSFNAGSTAQAWMTSGVLRIGASGQNYVKLSSSELSFRTQDDVSILIAQASDSSVRAGLPPAVKLSDTGVRILSGGTGSGFLAFDDSLETTDDGMFKIASDYAGSGEWTSTLSMPSRAGSTGYFNDITLTAGAITGSTGKNAIIAMRSIYNAGASYIKLMLGGSENLSVYDGYTYVAEDLRVLNGIAVGANVDPTTKTIQMAETTAPSSSSGYGKIFCHSSYNAAPFCEDDLGNDIPMGIFHNMLSPFDGYYTLSVTSINNVNAVVCSAAGNSIVDWIFPLPRGWADKTMTIYIYWASSDTNTGNVYWIGEVRRLAGGVTIPSTATVSGNTISAAPGYTGRVVSANFNLSLLNLSEGDAMALRLYRAGDSANDTYPSNCYLLGIKLSVVG